MQMYEFVRNYQSESWFRTAESIGFLKVEYTDPLSPRPISEEKLRDSNSLILGTYGTKITSGLNYAKHPADALRSLLAEPVFRNAKEAIGERAICILDPHINTRLGVPSLVVPPLYEQVFNPKSSLSRRRLLFLGGIAVASASLITNPKYVFADDLTRIVDSIRSVKLDYHDKLLWQRFERQSWRNRRRGVRSENSLPMIQAIVLDYPEFDLKSAVKKRSFDHLEFLKTKMMFIKGLNIHPETFYQLLEIEPNSSPLYWQIHSEPRLEELWKSS